MTTQEEHQELAHLRAEVHRLQADSSRAIAALAECIGERDDLKAKLESTKSQMVELKRAFLSAENDVCAYRNKLAQCEGQKEKYREETFRWGAACKNAEAKLAQVEGSHDKEIGEFQDEVRNFVIERTGAPENLIDGKGSDSGWQEFTLAEIGQGVAFLKGKLAQVEAELAKEITLVDDMIDLRRRECDYMAKVEATAKRRLELLQAVDWCSSDCDCDQFRCFWCQGIKPKHDSDCPLAQELKEGK